MSILKIIIEKLLIKKLIFASKDNIVNKDDNSNNKINYNIMVI